MSRGPVEARPRGGARRPTALPTVLPTALMTALLTALLTVLLAAGWAAAEPQLTLELTRDRRDRPLLVATATDETGAPVTRHEVAFYLLPDFFPNRGERISGMHPVLLGTDTSDAVGTADEILEPLYTGTARFEARLLSEDGSTLATGRLEAEMVREASPMPDPIPPPLASVRRPIEISILAAVALVWLLLFGVLVVTLRSIRRIGKEATAHPQA